MTTNNYNGLTTSVTDANNHTHTTVSDILGRTLSVTPPTGPAVLFTYDPLGNMLSAARGGATVTLSYDNAGRKLSMDDPDMGFWSYQYDALGAMTSQTDARGCVTNLDYDLLGRPTSKTYTNCPSTPNVQYYYDGQSFSFDNTTYGSSPYAIGRRIGMVTSGSNASAWTYDLRGRLESEIKDFANGGNFTTQWTYNLADLPVTMTYPDGEVVTTKYNNRMLFDKLVNENGTPGDTSDDVYYVYASGYDSAGRMTSRELGNGLEQTYEYYPWNAYAQGGRLKTLAAETLQNMTYIYDSVGNITSITDSINTLTQSFGYDELDRLTSASASGTPAQGAYSEAYEYDSDTGNLKIKGGVTLGYLDSSHAHAVTSAGGNTYAYDSNGNQTTRNIGSDTFDLSYDAENRLVEVKKNSATIAQFTFDGDGKRVKSVMDGETILFVGSHFEQKGSQATKYYFAGASRIAIRKYTIPQNMTVEYMLGDHLGSTSITTNSAGALVSELRYKAWGETRYTWTDAPVTTPTYELTRYQYTGQYAYDPEFGLKFYNARWLDSATGRFIQADTMIPQNQGTQAWDRYAYTNNNPVKYTDPSGHFIPWLIAAGIAGAIVATPFVLSSLGARPDVEGAMIASAVTMNQDSNILVQAGIAVQSQYPLSIVGGDNRGWAQASSKELSGRNPFSPSVSVEIMGNRIDNALSACKQCNSAVDKLVVAALAQNGFNFKPSGIGSGFPLNENNDIDWGTFLKDNGDSPSSGFQGMRQSITDRNFDTQLMLKLYIQDLLLLVSMGYELPDWLTEEDIQIIVDNNYFSEEDEEQ